MNTTRPRIAPAARSAATRAAIVAFLDEQYEPVTRADVAKGAGVSLSAAHDWLPRLAARVGAGPCGSDLWVGSDDPVYDGRRARRTRTDSIVSAYLAAQHEPKSTGEIVGATGLFVETVRNSLFRVAVCVGRNGIAKLWVLA